MALITFITANGGETAVDAAAGDSIMRAALNAGVPGIEAECGGVLACATCRVHVAPDWQEQLPPAQEEEAQMLEYCEAPAPATRLSCQIVVSDGLDGLRLTIPENQF